MAKQRKRPGGRSGVRGFSIEFAYEQLENVSRRLAILGQMIALFTAAAIVLAVWSVGFLPSLNGYSSSVVLLSVLAALLALFNVGLLVMFESAKKRGDAL